MKNIEPYIIGAFAIGAIGGFLWWVINLVTQLGSGGNAIFLILIIPTAVLALLLAPVVILLISNKKK